MKKLRNVVYKSRNLIVQCVQKGFELCNIAVIVGNGHSICVDEYNNITFSDPGYHKARKIRGYGRYCTIFTVYYPETCEGLAVAGKELAEFINTDFQFYKRIILHGHYKCGCCFQNLAQWLDEWTTIRTYIVSVSAPLCGTPMVDYDFVCKKADSVKALSSLLKNIYIKLFSDHKVDRDVSLDSEFLHNLDLQSFNHLHREFIVSKCGFSANPIDWILCLVDIIAKINGDGIVSLESQIPKNSYRPITITASHATSMRKSCKFIRNLIEN